MAYWEWALIWRVEMSLDSEILGERVYTLMEVANVIGMKRRYVLKQVHEGRLQAERYGTVWRVRESDLLRFVEERRHQGR